MRLTIIHLYPDHMNLYGDFGNVQTLERRAAWRGIETEIRRVGIGEPIRWDEADLFFLGGGQDRGQELIAPDLQKRAGELKAAASDGLAGLLICGGYQLFGDHFRTADGHTIPGIGLLPAHTSAGPRRLIGNLVGQLTLTLTPQTLVGFENHSGQTLLGEDATPLARVVRGYGNNGRDGTEGIIHGNLIGSYCHGSLLPKNPHLADWLLRAALTRRHGSAELAPLDDSLELRAHRDAIRRAETAKTLHI